MLHNKSDSPVLFTPSPLVKFLPFADGGVLYYKGISHIWVLNASSALIWCALAEYPNPENLSSFIAGRFSIDIDTARRDVFAVLANFEREGLLGNGRPDTSEPAGDMYDIITNGPSLSAPGTWKFHRSFRTPNHIFELCTDDSTIGYAFAAHMDHLACEQMIRSQTSVAVLCDNPDRSCAIYINGKGYMEGIPENEVLPYLFTIFFLRSCDSLAHRYLIHAAVLGWNEKAIIFPAEAGSGKTTLCAALATRGYTYLSDELAVLDTETRSVSSYLLPMSIKPGSVAPLQPYYPDLAERKIYSRADTKLVRYLAPPAYSLPESDADCMEVATIICPLFKQNTPTALIPLDKVKTLQRLAQCGSSSRELTEADVRAMIDVVENAACHELVYSDLGKAIKLIEDLKGVG